MPKFSAMASYFDLATRRSQRLTITVPYNVAHALAALSTVQGRSISNLAAFLLKSILEDASGE
ncbi:MAG: ribbon-helix-helix domain-containing protein [Burkholderiaceae bacterium]